MREQVHKPAIHSHTLQSKPRANRQASIVDVLQAYRQSIVQRESIDEDELLQGKFEIAQREAFDDEDLLQGKFETVQHKEPPNNTGLPDRLKAGVENLSGYSMDDVRVHYNSPKPAQLQALAYTQGNDIHVAPRQEQHLAHEAWHVVQQKQGRVQPTRQLQGVSINDNEGLEKEADMMGDKICQNKFVTQKKNQSLIVSRIIQYSKEKSRKSKAMEGVQDGFLEGLNFGCLSVGIESFITDEPLSIMKILSFGIVGAAVKGIKGFYSGYKTYTNGQAAQYENELKTYQGWLDKRSDEENHYNSGRVFTDPTIIHDMLQIGKVMYVYDEDEQLKVSGNHDPIKHAILAENKDVYAAGTTELLDDERTRIETAISWVHTRDENLANIELVGLDKQYEAWVNKSKIEIGLAGFDENIAMDELTQLHSEHIIEKDSCTLTVTEDSGHYHPGYESGHAALEAWNDIGYFDIKWTPRWTKKKWFQSTVRDVK